MAVRRAYAQLSQLWQVPLLVLSLGLFGYATYLFIDPQPGPTIEDQLTAGRTFLKQERPDAANALLNKVLTNEKLTIDQQARTHLMLAESIDMAQKQRKISVGVNYVNVIKQTSEAVSQGAKLDALAYRRLGEAFEALNKPADALENYRKAMSMDVTHSLRLQRKVIDLQLAQDDGGPAEISLDEYLKSPTLTEAERGWALGQKSQILIDEGKFAEAQRLLDESLKIATASNDKVALGEVNYRLGYCAYKLSNIPDAERSLRVCREQLKTGHPLDGDAAYYLGKICQDRGEIPAALSFFEDVIVSHIDLPIAPAAQMQRGVCRIIQGHDDAGLNDLHEVVNQVQTRQFKQKLSEQCVAALQQASQILSGRGNIEGAIELLAAEQTLNPDPAAGFYARLASVFEKRAQQLDRSIPTASAEDRIKREQQVREFRTRAGDACIAYSRKLTLTDDKGYGDALWRGIELYDSASNVQAVITALDLFVAERPSDPLAPDALLRLGKAYQAAGQFDKAIDAYQMNAFRYPKSLAASKSAVPLAQALIAKGADSYGKAEKVLRNVIEDNPLVSPEAEEFKSALFEVAQLYYRTSRYEEAIGRLEEFTKRYPDDARSGQLLFLMADSYRKSAAQLDQKLATADASPGLSTVDPVAAAAAKRDRLLKAKELYDKVVDQYHVKAPVTAIDKLYLKLAHFYRADCMYDLGEYAEAVKLYGAAAFRYEQDPSALAAYVQIVNSYCALGKMQEARTANERAKLLLHRIPEESFKDGTFSMPKEYWDQWLKWTGDSGMWAESAIEPGR